VAVFRTRKIDSSERAVLTIVAVLASLGGLIGGLGLALTLDGRTVVQATFWTTLLTVSAVAALPLVATATGLARLWKPARTGNVAFVSLAPLVMLGAAAISLVEIVVCLHQIAITDKLGDPNDLAVYLTTIPAGLTLGAAVFGVAWAMLDKMDDPPPFGGGHESHTE
jgi:hypothetical protein